nr:unnamed protein product [Leishmania braziliensis]
MTHYASPSQSSDRDRCLPRPRTSLRVRNIAVGVIYHLVFEGDVQRLSGKQLRHHLARISHIPPEEQQLFVHGQLFAPNTIGAAVGLHAEDVLDLVQIAKDGRDHNGRGSRDGGDSMATVPSPRPSTEAGTLSPTISWQGNSRSVDPRTMRRGGGAGSASASMASSASASTRRAPSPNLLVNAPPSPAKGAQGQTTAGDDLAREPLPQQLHPAPLNDSSLPLWTSATTLSSLPSENWANGGSGNAESPRPQMTARCTSRSAQGSTQAAVPPYAYPQPSPLPPELRAQPSGSRSDRFRRSSYEIASPPPSMQQRWRVPHDSPSPLSAPPPLTSRSGSASRRGVYAAPAAGLNYSHHDDHQSNFCEQASGGPLLSQRAPQQQQVYRPRAASSALHNGLPHVAASIPHSAVIRADELETILDEENYIWEMEAYRFRTERQKRLTALQHQQHELELESTRYDQAVAEVERQLARERRKLAELQQAMEQNATVSCSVLDRGHGLQEPLATVRDALDAVTRYLPVMHHGQARDHAHNGAYDALCFPARGSDGGSAIDEEVTVEV